MKKISLVSADKKWKEKLLSDLLNLGYQILPEKSEEADILITDIDSIKNTASLSNNAAVLLVVDSFSEVTPEVALKASEIISTPYDSHELELRLRRAVLRSGRPEIEEKEMENIITAGNLMINLDSYEVLIDGKPLDLTFKEYELLKCLVKKKGRVYTREQLLSTIWGFDYFGGMRTVDVHIRRLRSKLGRYESYIETVRNVGYRFRK